MRWAGTWWAGTSTAPGAPVNLTGYALVAELRQPSAPAYLEEAAVVLGDQVASPGTYTVDVSSLELLEGSYQLRLRITEPDGDIYRSSPILLVVETP